MKFDWRSVLIGCLLLMFVSPTVVAQIADATKHRKVSVTLVRWPYT